MASVETKVGHGENRAVVQLTEKTLRELLHAARKAKVREDALAAGVESEHSNVEFHVVLDRGDQESEGFILTMLRKRMGGEGLMGGPDPDWLEEELQDQQNQSHLQNCICFTEPRGDHGLEGYMRDDGYLFEELESGRIRIWDPPYCDTVGPGVFRRYFKPLGENGEMWTEEDRRRAQAARGGGYFENLGGTEDGE